jgi:hypothetical protein
MAGAMSAPSPKRAPLALCTRAGPVVAAMTGHSTSLGFLVGLGVGVAIALLIWLSGK